MVGSPVESFITHSNYIRAFSTLVGADIQASPYQIYRDISNRIVQSGCLASRSSNAFDDNAVFSSLKNAWGTELLIDMGKHFVDDPELCRLSNNWSIVQLYYVLYHATQAVALAKGFLRPTSHPKTLRFFHSFWASRNICLEPWTISYDSQGSHNIPSHITVDDTIHQWSHCSSDTAWSLACKALKTTRDDKLEEAFKKARANKKQEKLKILRQKLSEKINQGKARSILPKVPLPRFTPNEKLYIEGRESPTTIIDYFYRLRIKTNYVESSMFTDGCKNDDSAIQVRDDLIIVAGSFLLLAELTISKILGSTIFNNWINNWTRNNVPSNVTSGIKYRLKIHTE
ncbi:hypothetical protein ACFLVH_02125 [Chloroflexota bacterium]